MSRPFSGRNVGQLVAEVADVAGRAPTLLVGVVMDVDPTGVVTTAIGGLIQIGTPLTATPVQIGDNVLAVQQNGLLYILGPLAGVSLPTTGTVSAVPMDSDSVTVDTTIGSINCSFPDAYTTPTVGDAVIIWWAGSTPIAMKQGMTGTPAPPTPPPTPTPPPKPPSASATGTTLFIATACGTFRGGEWLSSRTTDGNVMAGDYGFGLNDGAWFYGGHPKATLAGRTVKSAQIWLGRGSGGVYAAQTVHLYRVTNDKQPSGDLTFDGGTTHDVSLKVGQTGWFTLPAAFAQTLIDSGGSVGIKAPSGPYVRMYGLTGSPASGQAGALKITWSK